MRHKPRIPALLLMILIASWGMMMINLDSPWWEQGGDNGAWISATVRNYERYGALNVGLLQIRNNEITTPENFLPYVHHPPIIVWQTAITSALFGFHEMSFRYLAAIMTLISSVAMYVVIRRLTRNESQALWGMALYAFTPMMLYYGRMPDHEAPALAFVLALIAVTINLSYRITGRGVLAMVVLTILCTWTAWAVVIFVGFIGLWLLWINPKRNWKLFLVIGCTAIVSVLVLIIYYQSQYPDTINELINVFFRRASNRQLRDPSATFTMGEFIWQNFVHIISLYSPSMFFLLIFGWIFAKGRASYRAKGMIIALLVAAITYFLVFRNATYIHNYYKIYLSPGFALSASFAMVAYQTYRGRKRRVVSAVMNGLIVGGVITGGFFFSLLHQSVVRPQLDEVRALLSAQSQTDDPIYTNLDYGLDPLSMYLSTNFRQINDLDDVLSMIKSGAKFGYLYCDEGAGDDPFELPEALSQYDAIQSESCFYLRF